MNKSISINTDHRRSSVSSSCPSSIASSFSSSTEYSDPIATPSPSPWAGGFMNNHQALNDFPFSSMKNITEGAFAAEGAFVAGPEFYSEFSAAGDPMQLEFIPTAAPFRNASIPFGYEDAFDSIDPTHTMNSTNSSPCTLVGNYEFRPTFDDVKIYEDEGFISMSHFKKQEDDDLKVEHKYLYPHTLIKKERKRSKCVSDFPVTVTPGKFKCSYKGCTTTKKFVRAEHLKRHEKTHDTSGKYNVHCRWCPKPFSRADNLRDHEKRHADGKGDGVKSGKRVKFEPGAKEILEREDLERKRRVGATKAKNPRSRP